MDYQPALQDVRTTTWDPVEGFAPEGMKWVQVQVIETGNGALYGHSPAYVPNSDRWSLMFQPQPALPAEPAERFYTVTTNTLLGMGDTTTYTVYAVPIDVTEVTLEITTSLELGPGNPPSELADAEPLTVELTLP